MKDQDIELIDSIDAAFGKRNKKVEKEELIDRIDAAFGKR